MTSAFSLTSCGEKSAMRAQGTRPTNDVTLKRDLRVTHDVVPIEVFQNKKDSETSTNNNEDNDDNGNNEVKAKGDVRDNEQNDKFAAPYRPLAHETGLSSSLSSCFSKYDGGNADGEDPGEDDGELSYFLSSLCERNGVSDTEMKVATERASGVRKLEQEADDLVTVVRPSSFSSIAIQGPRSLKRRKIGENRYTLLLETPSTSLPMFQDSTDTKCVREIPISASDFEVWYRDLGEELASHGKRANISRCSTPVALLTPPQSPMTIEMDGTETTMCEWPSNLAVDSAMTAVINEIRPMTPESLQHFEQVEESRVTNLGVDLTFES